jgi:NDP-sugar pyrophosphorylase family protein
VSAFVILAAGRGTRVGRVGDTLHKALLPLGGRAIISHQLEQIPSNVHVIVCLGYRGAQVREYLQLAHPDRRFTFVTVAGWNTATGGPGASLYAARHAVRDEDFYVTSCDTLWDPGTGVFTHGNKSWVGVAPIPPGTSLQRWCVAETRPKLVGLDEVVQLHDKNPDDQLEARRWITTDTAFRAYTGLAHVSQDDAEAFWRGLATGEQRAGELQVSSGLDAIQLHALEIRWTDVGDEAAYRAAVQRVSGYDWTKLGQATYVLPETGRVVKFISDPYVIHARRERGRILSAGVPELLAQGDEMLAYQYVRGRTAYEELDTATSNGAVMLTRDILDWHRDTFGKSTSVAPRSRRSAATEFYDVKTYARLALLPLNLQDAAVDAVDQLGRHPLHDELLNDVVPVYGHGDFNFGNLLYDSHTPNHWVGIDWREDFAGRNWVDYRYDLGKLLAGCVVHWGNARRGDFTPWNLEGRLSNAVRRWITAHVVPTVNLQVVEAIGALSLLNSAALHAAPLNEVLVSRGVAWLTEVMR